MQEINNECWRNVSEYLNYQVSNVGRVRNSFTGKILKPQTCSNAYLQVALYKDRKMKFHLIHRLVAKEFIENPEEKPYVDHINHDRTDNAITNLRWASKSQNAMNTKKRSNASSKYKGVNFHSRDKIWRAYVQIDGKQQYLGHYDNEKQAAARYNEEAVNLFGEYASLNDISDEEDEEETEDVDESE